MCHSNKADLSFQLSAYGTGPLKFVRFDLNGPFPYAENCNCKPYYKDSCFAIRLAAVSIWVGAGGQCLLSALTASWLAAARADRKH